MLQSPAHIFPTHYVKNPLLWRYAVKKFDSTKRLTPAQLKTVTDALRLAPSSYGLQPWKFLIITDPKVRETLKAHSWGQGQVTDASHLIVLLAKDDMDEAYIAKYVDEIAAERGVAKQSLQSYFDMMKGGVLRMSAEDKRIWMEKQAYIALGQCMTVCAYEGIDTCPMEGFDAAKYDEVLTLKGTGYHTTVVLPVGFRAKDDDFASAAKVRKSEQQVFEVR